MSDVATRHMTTPAMVATLIGRGARGPLYSPETAVLCWPEQGAKLVRDAQGSEVTSSTRLWCEAAHEPLFPPGSLVTIHGAPAQVIAVSRHDPGALPLPALLEVSLQ